MTEELTISEAASYDAVAQIEGPSEVSIISPAVTSDTMQVPTPAEKLDLSQTQDRKQTPSPPAQLTPALTTATVPLLRGLDEPIGSAEKFIIHQIKIGESLGQYASTYQTSAAAILQVNCAMPVPLWVDAYLVIPLNPEYPAELPCFQPYQVIAESISAEALATELGTDLHLFTYYNKIEPGEKLKAGEWLLIPRVAPGND